MTDPQTPAGEAPAADPAPQAPAATPDPTPAPQATPPATPTVDVTPDIQALIDAAATDASRKANAEAKNLRDRATAAEAELQKLKDLELSDLERVQKEAATATERAIAAEQRAQTKALEAAVTAEAVKTGIDPALAMKLIDGVTFDDDGNPTGVDTALATLAQAHPNLVTKTPIPQQNPASPPRGAGNTPPVSDAERLAANRAGRDNTASNWWDGGGVLT